MGGAYHHGNLKRALMDAALEVIDREGVAGLTMARLARAAGVSSGAPYRHFKSTDALLVELASEGWRMLMEANEALEGVATGPLDRYRRSGVAAVRFAATHPSLFRLMSSPQGRRLEDPTLNEQVAATDAQVRQMVSEMVATGELEGEDIQAQTLAGQALAYGLARLVVDGALEGLSPDDAEALAWRVTAVLGTGLAPRS